MSLDDFVPRLTIRVHVRALVWAVIVWACWASAAASTVATGFDFDEIMMVAMGFAGLAYVIADLKRERRLDQFAVAICEDIGEIKASIGAHNPNTIVERVATLEARVPDDIESRLCGLENDEDIHAIEKRLAAVELAQGQYELGERLATLEARADFKPWQATRGKGGKFAKVEPVTPPPEGDTKP